MRSTIDRGSGRGALLVALAFLSGAAPARAESGEATKDDAALSGSFEGEAGEWAWGLSLAVLRVRSARRPTEPGRGRDYRAEFDALPGTLGFQLRFDPDATGFYERAVDGNGHLQTISLNAFVLLTIDTDVGEQSEVALGLGVSFIDGLIGLGFTFDLYRGVPTLGVDADGSPAAGAGTAYTGLFGWAFAREGEITAENVAFVINFDITAVTRLSD